MLGIRRTSIFFFVFLILLCASVSAIAELEVLKQECNEDGSMTLEARNQKDDPIFLDSVMITAKHATDDSPRKIDGAWDKELIKYEVVQRDGIAKFKSAPGLLDDPGDYHVLVSYKGCRDDPRCKLAFRLQSCPGEKIRCNEEGVTTQSCIIHSNTAYVSTTSKAIENPEKELLMYFESSRRNLNGVHAFPGLTINPTEEGYLIKLQLEDGETIESAGVRRKVCSADAVIVPCEDPIPETVEATETIIDIPQTAQDLEAITGAAVGPTASVKQAFISGKSMGVLFTVLLAGIAYLTFSSRARNPKKKETRLGGLPKIHTEETEEDESLVVDDKKEEDE